MPTVGEVLNANPNAPGSLVVTLEGNLSRPYA